MHENAGNIGLRMDYFETIYRHLGVNIVTFAYRGYSNSEGSPTEAGLKLDSDAIINFVKNENSINKNRVFLLGRSLGGAVALHTVKNHPTLFRGVIVENTFTSLPDMVD